MYSYSDWIILLMGALCLPLVLAVSGPGPGFSPAHGLLLKRAISYESVTPLPCVLGCSASLDLINECIDTASLSSPPCQSACSTRNYSRTVQCLECSISNGGEATTAELQDILNNLNQVCGNINIGLDLQGSITGSPTTTGPFSTSTEGSTLTLEIWTGLTSYITAGGGSVAPGTETGESGLPRPSDTGRPIPSVISTPQDSTTSSRSSRSAGPGSGSGSSIPSASAPAATTSAPNSALRLLSSPSSSLFALVVPLLFVVF